MRLLPLSFTPSPLKTVPFSFKNHSFGLLGIFERYGIPQLEPATHQVFRHHTWPHNSDHWDTAGSQQRSNTELVTEPDARVSPLDAPWVPPHIPLGCHPTLVCWLSSPLSLFQRLSLQPSTSICGGMLGISLKFLVGWHGQAKASLGAQKEGHRHHDACLRVSCLCFRYEQGLSRVCIAYSWPVGSPSIRSCSQTPTSGSDSMGTGMVFPPHFPIFSVQLFHFTSMV